jgi:hypothetical protein
MLRKLTWRISFSPEAWSAIITAVNDSHHIDYASFTDFIFVKTVSTKFLLGRAFQTFL